jgi:GR25 family glycosyltransferase involved in LPS biosynthesis
MQEENCCIQNRPEDIRDFGTSIDSVYCINLCSRDDKFNYSKKIFKNLGIPNLKFHRVYKNPEGGERGCFESHVNIAKEAYFKGYKNVLIFEDDILPNKITKERLSKVNDFIKEKKKWDLFYLGLCPHFLSISQEVSGHPCIHRVKNLCTHAYVLNRPYMKKVSEMKYNGIPIDSVYNKNNNSYGIYPSLFYQKEFETDIQLDKSFKLKEKFVQRYKPLLLDTYEKFFFNREFILVFLLFFVYIFMAVYRKI